MKQFIPFVLLYFIWDFVSALLSVEGPFELVHWLMLVMTIIFAVLLVITGKEAIADSKRKKEEREKELEKQRLEQAARRRAIYLADFEDAEEDTQPATVSEEPENEEELEESPVSDNSEPAPEAADPVEEEKS